ncbi:MAG TPA: hypothetical protein VGI93_15905 [Steroidobacteraceae bacterium]|jgi:uncharacterized membrane protein YkvA (DUF1232 family)
MRRLFRLWSLAGRDLRLIFAVLRSPGRPSWLAPAMLALMVFGLDPLNLAIPVLGVVDDFVLLPLLIRALAHFAQLGMQRSLQRSRDDRVVSVQ